MIAAGVRIFVCTEAVDMRWGFDRLAAVAKSRVGEDPQSGEILVVFGNRGATRLKLLWFDRNGYCMLYKRLERGRFAALWRRKGDGVVSLTMSELALMLEGCRLEAKLPLSPRSWWRALVDNPIYDKCHARLSCY